LLRGAQRLPAGRERAEVLFRAPAAFRRGLAQAVGDVALLLETVERRVHGAIRDLAARALLDLLAHLHAVRVVAESQECEKHELLEFTHRRFSYSDRSASTGDTRTARKAGITAAS